MGLLDLPLEVLDHIIGFTLPGGIESFALSCKTIYIRARPQIARHNALRRQWRHTTNAGSTRRGDTLRILYEISRDNLVAEYIESLSLWDQRTQDQLRNEPALEDFRGNTSAMDDIKEMLALQGELTNSGFSPSGWWDRLIEEDALDDADHTDKLFAIISLLGLLPNLKTLQLPDRWHEVQISQESEHLVQTIEALIAESNKPGSRFRNLRNLHTLLPFVEEGYDIRVGLQCLQPFMVLPGIRELYAVSCVAVDDAFTGIPFHWNTPGLTSPLTKVEFASCCMDADGISALLVNTPNLTVFKYSHQTKWHGCEHDWNPGAFVETIANHLGKQLIELAITVDQLHGEVINGMSSFLRFPALRKIEVDVLPFCGPPLESGQQLGINASIPDGATPWTQDDIPCLGDMLPENIEELQVNITFPEPDQKALVSLFKNIKIRRSGKLKSLDKVIIRQYQYTTAQQFADEHDIVLEVFEENVENPRPRSMMPAWKREFDEKVGGIVFT